MISGLRGAEMNREPWRSLRESSFKFPAHAGMKGGIARFVATKDNIRN
jgi:hypothetical protein